MGKEVIRRSITIPKNIDEKITMMANKYSYTVKNSLFIELLELGIIKFDEDMELKNNIINLISKINELIEKLDD